MSARIYDWTWRMILGKVLLQLYLFCIITMVHYLSPPDPTGRSGPGSLVVLRSVKRAINRNGHGD